MRQMRHFTITFEPEDRQISIQSGVSLLEAAGQAGIILNTSCGGSGTCKKCLVILEPSGQKVLACQYLINQDLTVTIPQESRFFEQKILESGITSAAKASYTIYDKYRAFAPEGEIYGVAVDIGTTTVVAKLINLKDGRHIATESALNPQTQFGSDVISRITYADTPEKAAQLKELIIFCIKKLIAGLCSKALISYEQIYELCAVGNTTMNHILLGFPIVQLGLAPYKAYSVDAYDLPPDKLGLNINSKGNIHTVENIAGFVGSDTTAVALAAGISSEEKMTLIVDIGTNGEIVLGNKDRLFAASCAAGPALEGAGISCGSTAQKGAIEGVLVAEDDIVVNVIGNTPASVFRQKDAGARSICGSGIIDAVAVLLDLGVINKTGRFAAPGELKDHVSDAIIARFFKSDGRPAFRLTKNVFITAGDIRQVQLAKAAIRAGMALLQKEMAVVDDNIEQILLAGAFGNYIRKENALRIGLLPDVGLDRIHFIGNAAASGAQIILVSQIARQKAHELAKQIKYIEIAQRSDFPDTFAKCLSF
jgi:uncharacterized 2Fe-2S/4Fe-4S cluster protein (DUF4445 family)